MNGYFIEDDIRIRLKKQISVSTSHLTQRDFVSGIRVLLDDRATKKNHIMDRLNWLVKDTKAGDKATQNI